MIIDPQYEKMRHRLRRVKGRSELLAKAVGFKGEPFHIFDTTAGLGRDSLMLSALGLQVTMFERHPLVGLRLEAGLNNLLLDDEFRPLIARMSLSKTCAIDYLANNDVSPDVIYCDPMFLPKAKRALVKKDMQELQSLVGHDDDAEELIAMALKRAKKRVVVKRASYSMASPKNPSVVFAGRSHRFDVYLIGQINNK